MRAKFGPSIMNASLHDWLKVATDHEDDGDRVHLEGSDQDVDDGSTRLLDETCFLLTFTIAHPVQLQYSCVLGRQPSSKNHKAKSFQLKYTRIFG